VASNPSLPWKLKKKIQIIRMIDTNQLKEKKKNNKKNKWNVLVFDWVQKKKEKEKTKSSCLKFDYQNAIAIASQVQLLIQALRGRVPLSTSQRARLSRVLGVSGGRVRVPRVRRAREPVFPGHPGKNKRFITTQFYAYLFCYV